MAGAFIEFEVPAVISSNISKGLPTPPGGDNDWKLLHKAHVSRLRSAWGALLHKFEIDRVVICSGASPLKYTRDDQHWPYVLTPHFSHWTPYAETPALLVIEGGAPPSLICERHSSYWEGPAPALATWDRESFNVRDVDDLAKESFDQNTVFIGDDIKLALSMGIRPEQCNREDLLTAADGFRTLKSEFEAASVRAANIVAARGHNKLRDLFVAGELSELELHHEYLRVTAQTDYTVPYGNIVAQGANCGILHHIHYDRSRRAGDLSLLVDAGASCHGYASDITRTWVRGTGEGAAAFRGLLTRMDDIQRTLVGHFTVGKKYEDLHNESHELLAGVLKDSGLVSCGLSEMVATGLTRLFFPHGLGHSLGLQVHDVGMKKVKASSQNPYLRNTSVIAAGQIVTVEPGLYFIPALMDEAVNGAMSRYINKNLLKALMPFGGIRIEDNILATASGPVNLTRDLIS